MKNEKLNVDVSIIIVNWNTREIACDCLKSVYEQTQHMSFEVIVVDNGSSDGSVEMVKNEYPRVILIENLENVGFAAANNQGMALAKGRYILLLNSDTVILDNAISKAISFSDTHPEAAVVGCRVLNPDRTLQLSCSMFPSLLNWVLFITYLYKLFHKNKFFGRERMSWWARNDIQEVEVVTGCFMLVRREAIEQVGMMDERFFMYAEEIDWCYRFRMAGWKNLFTPDAEIIHLGGVSAIKYGDERALIKDASLVKLMFKHWPKWRAKAGVLCMLMFYVSRLSVIIPQFIFNTRRANQDILANHITGLRGLLKFRQYLDEKHT